jgi:HAMP domain-containing protein
MRISLTTKLLTSYGLVLLLSMLPVLLYLRSHLLGRILHAVENDEDLQAKTVAAELVGVPAVKLPEKTRALTALVIDRITVFDPSERAVADSSGEFQGDNRPGRLEVHAARTSGFGSALEGTDRADTLLYVARPYYDSTGKLLGVVRLARPVGDILSSFERALQFFLRAAGAAASVALLLGLAIILFLVRPLWRMRQAASAYVRGEYTYALPHLPKDEIGELGEAVYELARSLQREMVHHSEETAARDELLRMLPLPLALLDAELSPLFINPEFRERLGIVPASEAVRIKELLSLAPARAALQTAREQREAVLVTLALPFLPDVVALKLCPLPRLGGALGWALLLTDAAERPEKKLEERAAPDDALLLGREAMRQLALRPAPLPSLLSQVLSEVAPLLAETGVALREELLPSATAVLANRGDLLQRVLRAAVVRAAGVASELRFYLQEEATTIRLGLSGLRQRVPIADLDLLLQLVGGGMEYGGALERPSADSGTPVLDGVCLWLNLRRA